MPGEHRGTPLDGGKSTEDAARSEEGYYHAEGLGGANVVVHASPKTRKKITDWRETILFEHFEKGETSFSGETR